MQNMKYLKVTKPLSNVWQISLSSPPDNRLTPELLSEFSQALDLVETQWREIGGGKINPKEREKFEGKGAGALIVTSDTEKFFSNGLDWERSLKIKNFFEEIYDPVIWRLLTFPLYTIAAINGHAFAGGMILALSCDYRVITSGKGFLCMNEVQFGSPLPNSFNALLTLRIPNPRQHRDTLLARRWTQPELLNMGLVDEVVDQDQVVKRAIEIGHKEGLKIAGGSWGAIKRGAYHPVLEYSQSYRKLNLPPQEEADFFKRVGTSTNKAKL
ncbi:uncharacterized protein IL334_002875 [Kwoniella shivajii]|uniref:Enoyl-CoA hydratase/isomerase n=1 Tax=Kwoniella shivajii TaxID=564305 RepID=A0ABZ1CX81_9TREE|nr:hypothetical protein IL334_002875 [Kwoniella shivajii]